MLTAQLTDGPKPESTDPRPEKIELENILRWEDDGGENHEAQSGSKSLVMPVK